MFSSVSHCTDQICNISILPVHLTVKLNDHEHASHVVLCSWIILFTNFELAWSTYPFLAYSYHTVDTLCHAVTLTFKTFITLP